MTHHSSISVQVLSDCGPLKQSISFAEVGLTKGNNPLLNLSHTFSKSDFDSSSSLVQAEQLIKWWIILEMIETTMSDHCNSLFSWLLT